jgi:hypothetical protein
MRFLDALAVAYVLLILLCATAILMFIVVHIFGGA